VEDFNLNTAQVYIVSPDDRYLLWRQATGASQVVDNLTELPPRYVSKAKGTITATTKEIQRSSTDSSVIERWFVDSNPAEVIGLAPIHLDNVKPGHSDHEWLALVAVPRSEAFATIYHNQVQIGLILVLSFLLIVLLGWYFGRWFVRPVHEIID